MSTNHPSLLYALFLVTRVLLALLLHSDMQMNVGDQQGGRMALNRDTAPIPLTWDSAMGLQGTVG